MLVSSNFRKMPSGGICHFFQKNLLLSIQFRTRGCLSWQMYKAKSGGSNRVESAMVEPQVANQALTEIVTLSKLGAEMSSA
jgi:hypothetical protein